MRSKLTLMLVALLAMAGIATAQTPQEAKAAKQKAKQAAAARRAINDGALLAGNDFVQFYKRSDTRFDIVVKHNYAWQGTTYSDGGYATYIKFDGSDKVALEDFINAETVVNETVVNGIKVNLTAKVPSAASKVVNIKYTVKNTTSETKTFKLGSCADTELAENDEATISREGNVITMSDPYTGASYSLVISSNATDPASMWYGYYYDRYDNVFSNTPESTAPFSNDSGLAWSWSITLAPNQTKVFTVGGGSEVDATVVDNTGTVSMDDYTYGAATNNPSVSGYNGTPEITYYYNTTNSNQGGTPWSLDAGGSLNAGTYYMYAVLAATDGFNEYTTDPVAFTVNPIVYDAGSSSDAIDLNVPANLGQMDLTNGPTDLAAFLEDYQKIHVNPAYIKLTLEPGAKYVISKPLTTMSAITIVGDEKNPAIIDASQLGANPFVIIDRNHQVNEKNEKGFLTSIYNVEFKNFIVEKAQGSLFSSNGQKYDILYMTIDNVVYEASYSGMPLISLLGGGIVENLTMTRSTAFTSGYLYNGNGSATLAEAGVNSQKFTFSYNTLVVTYGLVHADASESAKRTITVDHNVIMEQAANFVTGLNAGDANWIVQYNAFQKEVYTTNANGDYVFDDLSNTEDANGAAGSIKGNMVWVNTEKLFEDLGENVINFPMGDCPQRDAKIGDPRWLSAKMRIKEADVDDDNDLAKVINEGVKKGYTEFELVQNQSGNLRYTVKQSIVTDKAISITGENVQIDVESGDDFIKVANVAGEKAKKADGSDSNYTIVENITLKGLTINGLTKSLINNTSGNVVFTKISIDDDVIDFSGSSAVFALGNGYPEDLTITKSTLWSQAGHTGFLFQAQGRPKDATGSTSWTIEKSTLYQIAKGKKMNNNNSGIKGQSTTKLTLTESILFETGSNTGNEINGWLFGQNSASPVRTYNKNTYWAGNAVATGWTDSSKTGSDQTGTALTTDPLSAYSAQLSEQTGDPRWFIEGGHYNPVTGIETVKTAEETSLENAVIYNLNGQRVEKAQKGINIVNGKKVIIK